MIYGIFSVTINGMRQDPKRLHRQRAQLDARLAAARVALGMAGPRGGWLKAVRESLGMPAEQLGKRLGVSKQSVLKLERNEQRGTASLESLQRAARALGCRLTYAIVPEESLDRLLGDQARAVARKKLGRVRHSMALEGQEPPANLHELQVEELANELKQKLGPGLWQEG